MWADSMAQLAKQITLQQCVLISKLTMKQTANQKCSLNSTSVIEKIGVPQTDAFIVLPSSVFCWCECCQIWTNLFGNFGKGTTTQLVIGVFLNTVPKTWFIQQDTASMCTTITEQWWTPIFTHDLYNFNKVGLISWSEFQHQGKQTAHVNTRSWKRNRCFMRILSTNHIFHFSTKNKFNFTVLQVRKSCSLRTWFAMRRG